MNYFEHVVEVLSLYVPFDSFVCRPSQYLRSLWSQIGNEIFSDPVGTSFKSVVVVVVVHVTHLLQAVEIVPAKIKAAAKNKFFIFLSFYNSNLTIISFGFVAW